MVKSGQLDLIHGGWTATDEATPIYEDLILNMNIGSKFLKETFGVSPKVGWMLDAFGHSATNADLFTSFGLDYLFFSRVSVDVRKRLKKDKSMTFMWRPYKEEGHSDGILTHVFKKDYGYPKGWSYDERFPGSDPIIDLPKY